MNMIVKFKEVIDEHGESSKSVFQMLIGDLLSGSDNEYAIIHNMQFGDNFVQRVAKESYEFSKEDIEILFAFIGYFGAIKKDILQYINNKVGFDVYDIENGEKKVIK